MLKSYKNFWSLNTEEVLVANVLRKNTKKEVEVFFPLNGQMKDIDLVLVNLKNKKTKTIQVKGSKAYEGNKKQIERYGYGSYSWIDIKKNAIDSSTADYFVFMIYTLEQFNENKKGKIYIKHHTITIQTLELKRKVNKYKTSSQGIYRFQFWINPKTFKAFDFVHFKDKTQKEEDYSKYLDKKGFKKLNSELN